MPTVAYGMSITAPGQRIATATRSVEVAEIDPAALATRWRGRRRAAGRVLLADGSVGVRVFSGRNGWLLEPVSLGRFEVSADGRRIACAPAREGWPAFLGEQLLPFAAVLQGLEPLHAAGVVLDGRCLALAGPSGAGKSSVADALLDRGAAILADDVLTLEAAQDHVVAHPALPFLRPRRPDAGRVTRSGRRAAATRLDALYLLERGGDGGSVSVEPVGAPDPSELLGLSFNRAIRSAERLAVQLHLIALVANRVAVIRVRSPSGASPADTAAAIADHAGAER